MANLIPSSKIRNSLEQKYILYLFKKPKSDSITSNRYNLFDNINVIDKYIMKQIKNYINIRHKNSNVVGRIKYSRQRNKV